MFGYTAITTTHNIHQGNHFKMLLKILTGYKMQIYYLKMCSFYIHTHTHTHIKMAFLAAQPAIQETWVRSLGQEDPLGKGMATHSSILAWRIPWTQKPGGLQSMGSEKSWTPLRDYSSVQFSHSAMSDSLRLHESQHDRPPCPSPTPRVHPNSCASSQ